MGVELFVPDRGGEIKGNAFGPDESFDGSDNGPGFGWQGMSTLKFAVLHQLSDRVTLRATFAVDERNELSIAYTRGLENEVHGKGSIPSMLGGGEAGISLAEDSFGLAW